MKALIFEFLNTEWKRRHENSHDPLMDSVWVKGFLRKVVGQEIEVDDDLMKALIRLRQKFLKMVQGIIDGAYDPIELVDQLNCYITKSCGKRSIVQTDEGYRLQFQVKSVYEKDVFAELSADLFELLFLEDVSRIRICENPDCHYIFYDDSKNKSKRHCYSGCCNLMKVRRFRDKHKCLGDGQCNEID